MRLHPPLQVRTGAWKGRRPAQGAHGCAGVGPDAPPAVSSRESWAASPLGLALPQLRAGIKG